jgi:hypothetical protein
VILLRGVDGIIKLAFFTLLVFGIAAIPLFGFAVFGIIFMEIARIFGWKEDYEGVECIMMILSWYIHLQYISWLYS